MKERPISPLARDGVHEKVIDYLKDKPRGAVLDIPTGFGALAQKLSIMGYPVSCCDIDPERFAVKDLEVKEGDLNRTIPYEDGEFDYVCFLEGIEHTENPYNAVREIARTLKPGGTLIVSTPNYLNIERRLKFLLTGYFTKPVTGQRFSMDHGGKVSDMHLSPIGYTLIRFALEAAGLTITRITYDRRKPKQVFLKPLVWFIRAYTGLRPKKIRERYWLTETASGDILEGGNTLIIFARKAQDSTKV